MMWATIKDKNKWLSFSQIITFPIFAPFAFIGWINDKRIENQIRRKYKMAIQHHVTRSSMISEIDYDDENKVLIITFAKDGKYQYSEVPKSIYDDLLNADSVGKYFLANIKDKFVTERV